MSVNSKEYSNGEITIIWKSDVCIHSANCVRSLPGVFKPNERPWISIDNADTPHLIEAVEKCPSGALTWKKVSQPAFEQQVDAAVEKHTSLNIAKNGPILVKGKFTLTDAAGNTVETAESIALCRCGHSANKPFCDGAHRKANFEG